MEDRYQQAVEKHDRQIDRLFKAILVVGAFAVVSMLVLGGVFYEQVESGQGGDHTCFLCSAKPTRPIVHNR